MTDHDIDYRKVRFGVNLHFDINDYLKGRIRIKGKQGIALVNGGSCNLATFESELEEREKIIKQWLIANCTEEDLVKPRGATE